jgi:bifunctional UDP-N-acetylglucosamine pyrophosphorylase/glucosamine-1-phosphate N-acetyltransferase
MHNTEFIILAAGKGKRMESDLPKALTSLRGRAFLDYVLESLGHVSKDIDPIIVVGHKHEEIRKHIGENKRFVHQTEQLGTGHAVALAEVSLKPNTHAVVVLYADQPFLKGTTIESLLRTHDEARPTITMATTTVPDFNEWRGGFQNYSRVIRDDAGKIIRTVEYKDATEAEREIKEVNPCYFVFDKDWLFNKIKTLSKENAQGEYYLTDLIKIAFQEGAQIETVPISPIEAMGANSKEQLEMLELLFDAR